MYLQKNWFFENKGKLFDIEILKYSLVCKVLTNFENGIDKIVGPLVFPDLTINFTLVIDFLKPILNYVEI